MGWEGECAVCTVCVRIKGRDAGGPRRSRVGGESGWGRCIGERRWGGGGGGGGGRGVGGARGGGGGGPWMIEPRVEAGEGWGREGGAIEAVNDRPWMGNRSQGLCTRR